MLLACSFGLAILCAKKGPLPARKASWKGKDTEQALEKFTFVEQGWVEPAPVAIYFFSLQFRRIFVDFCYIHHQLTQFPPEKYQTGPRRFPRAQRNFLPATRRFSTTLALIIPVHNPHRPWRSPAIPAHCVASSCLNEARLRRTPRTSSFYPRNVLPACGHHQWCPDPSATILFKLLAFCSRIVPQIQKSIL